MVRTPIQIMFQISIVNNVLSCNHTCVRAVLSSLKEMLQQRGYGYLFSCNDFEQSIWQTLLTLNTSTQPSHSCKSRKCLYVTEMDLTTDIMSQTIDYLTKVGLIEKIGRDNDCYVTISSKVRDVDICYTCEDSLRCIIGR